MITREPQRYVVRGWDCDGRMSQPVYSDSADEARDAVRRLCTSVPSGVFSANPTRGHRAPARRGYPRHLLRPLRNFSERLFHKFVPLLA